MDRPHEVLPDASLKCLLCYHWNHVDWKLIFSKYIFNHIDTLINKTPQHETKLSSEKNNILYPTYQVFFFFFKSSSKSNQCKCIKLTLAATNIFVYPYFIWLTTSPTF